MRSSREDARAGDEEFARLVHRQSRFVFRVAYAMLRNPQDAEDAVQETFLGLYRSGAWRRMNDERAFLARAAWRQAIDRIRARPAGVEMFGELALKLPSADAGPEEAAIHADSKALVHRLIDALPEELRQPIALSSVEELNSREIAAILCIPESTVRTRLMRARKLLGEKLAGQMEPRHAK